MEKYNFQEADSPNFQNGGVLTSSFEPGSLRKIDKPELVLQQTNTIKAQADELLGKFSELVKRINSLSQTLYIDGNMSTATIQSIY